MKEYSGNSRGGEALLTTLSGRRAELKAHDNVVRCWFACSHKGKETACEKICTRRQ